MEKIDQKDKKQFRYLVPEPDRGTFVMCETLQEAQDYGKNVWWEKFDVLQIDVIQRFHFQKVFNNDGN